MWTTSSNIGNLLAAPSENQFPAMSLLYHNSKHRLAQHKTKMNIGKKTTSTTSYINAFGRNFGGAIWLCAVKT